MGEPNGGGGVLPPIGEEQQPRNPVLGRPASDDNELDLDKHFNEYIVNEFNKLLDIIFKYDKLDQHDKLNYLLDLGDYDDDYPRYKHDHAHNFVNDKPASNDDNSWADNIDNLTNGNPYNH